MSQIIYINSLPRSGSTILELILGGHPDLIGIGEVNQLLDPANDFYKQFHELTCSCGKMMDSCEYWKGQKKYLEENIEKEYSVKYQSLHNHFRDIFGEDKIMIDSSKNSKVLTKLSQAGYNIRVIHLVRDYRGWIQSVSKNNNSLFHYWRLLHSWHKKNKLLKSNLDQLNLPFITIGYEELALYPEMILKKICTFLDLEYHPDMQLPNKSKTHNSMGNRLILQEEKKLAIRYDNRWFQNYRINMLPVFSKKIFKFNKEMVYGNTQHTLWNDLKK